MTSAVADIGARTWRAVADECAARPDLFDEADLSLLDVIGLRMDHGLNLSGRQWRFLQACWAKLKASSLAAAGGGEGESG